MNQTSLAIEPIELPHQQAYNGQCFPYVLKCKQSGISLIDATAWASQQKQELIALSATHGALFLRGFPLKTAEDFDAMIVAFGLPNFPYKESLSNAVRINRTERVFTANEAPASVMIYLHHEMAQTPIFPSKLFFFCEQPPEKGGATPLCRSDVLLDQLKSRAPEFAQACQEKGLKYTNVMPAAADHSSGMGRSWQQTFNISTKHEAEARMEKLGYTWKWLEDGSLQATTPVLRAVFDLPDGRQSFFNQLIAASQGWQDARNDPSKSVTLGDGSPLDTESVLLAAKLGEELSFNVTWEQGDLALVDNFVTMHGRRPFTGTRKILASLVAADL